MLIWVGWSVLPVVLWLLLRLVEGQVCLLRTGAEVWRQPPPPAGGA